MLKKTPNEHWTVPALSWVTEVCLGTPSSYASALLKEQKSPPWSGAHGKLSPRSLTYETAYGCPYHPKANVCFVAVMETFPLVKQIFRAERNIWAARMCQNRTDACLLKTHIKKRKKERKPPCTWLLWLQPQWVKQEIRKCGNRSNPSFLGSSLFLSWFFSSRKWG